MPSAFTVAFIKLRHFMGQIHCHILYQYWLFHILLCWVLVQEPKKACGNLFKVSKTEFLYTK